MHFLVCKSSPNQKFCSPPNHEQIISPQNHEDLEELASVLTLLQCVLIKNSNLDEVAGHWVELYMETPTYALVTIMQFVVEASGSHYMIPKNTAMPFSYGDILVQGSLQYRSVSMFEGCNSELLILTCPYLFLGQHVLSHDIEDGGSICPQGGKLFGGPSEGGP